MSAQYSEMPEEMMPPQTPGFLGGGIEEIEEDEHNQINVGDGQLKLSDREKQRLAFRIRTDFSDAQQDHEARMNRFKRYYYRWRARSGQGGADKGRANFSIPLIKSQTFVKLAKAIEAILGDDAEIVAKPTGPADQKIVRKISRYMTWLVFNAMSITLPLVRFIFFQIIYGRAIAYAPYRRDEYLVPKEGWQVDYEGPGFEPQWPDDIITPSEDGCNIQTFSFVIRKVRVTPNELLRGEIVGTYQGIRENWEEIYRCAMNPQQRDPESDYVKGVKDRAEGVLYDNAASPRESLLCYEWYGKWRMLKGKGDGAIDNFSRREMYDTDIVVRYLPDLNLIISIQSLAELYPKMKNRRPFVEAALVEDGSYWGPGIAELLEDIEDEMTVAHNLSVEAGEMSVGPVIFYKPGTGFDADTFEYRPRMAVPCSNPGQDVKVAEFRANFEYIQLHNNSLRADAERLTGLSDQNVGRASDRPNAPRTARQTIALLEESNIRIDLDTRILREYLRLMLKHFWEIDTMYSNSSVFFRVTEEEANGLYDVKDGASTLTSKERAGKFDFDLTFATSVHSKEAKKQNQLALYQLDLSNPLITQNLRALWVITNEVHKSMGDDNFKDLLPEPPDIMPKSPRDEWNLVLQGEQIFINQQDVHQQHIQDHLRRVGLMMTAPPQDQDPRAIKEMLAHVAQHQQAFIQQIEAQAAMNAMLPQLQQLLGGEIGADQGAMAQLAGGAGGGMSPGQPMSPLASALGQGYPVQGAQQPMNFTGGMEGE